MEKELKIEVWVRLTVLGDGGAGIKLFPTEAEAREGLDKDGFADGESVPCQVEMQVMDIHNCKMAA